MNRTNLSSLVIGSSGQVSNKIASLLPEGSTVRTSRTPTSQHIVQMDLQELAGNDQGAHALLDRHPVSVVYCAGAMTYVDGCEGDPELAFRTNCYGPAALAAAAFQRGTKFVFFSTDYVFDGVDGPYTEEAPANPINIYGRSKWMGEQLVLKACPDALVIRTTGVFGEDARGKNFLYSLRTGLLTGKTVKVPEDQISTPTYNVDLARAVVELVRSQASGVFNITGPDLVSRLEFANRAATAMGLNSSGIVGFPTADLGQVAPRPLNAGLLIGKLKKHLPGLRMRGIEESVSEWAKIISAI